MPPVTPRRMRRPSKGRMGEKIRGVHGIGSSWRIARRASPQGGYTLCPGPWTLRLLSATARDDAVIDVARRELLEGARGELLLARRRPIARKLVQDARELRGDEDAEILVGRVLRDLDRGKDSHRTPALCVRLFFDLPFQFGHQPADLPFEIADALVPHRFRIDDRRD